MILCRKVNSNHCDAFVELDKSVKVGPGAWPIFALGTGNSRLG